MDLKFGKINLSRFKSSRIIEDNGQRGIFIPIEENHLIENFKHDVYVNLIHFKTNKLRPYSHTTNISVPKEFRKERDWLIGGVRLE